MCFLYLTSDWASRRPLFYWRISAFERALATVWYSSLCLQRSKQRRQGAIGFFRWNNSIISRQPVLESGADDRFCALWASASIQGEGEPVLFLAWRRTHLILVFASGRV